LAGKDTDLGPMTKPMSNLAVHRILRSREDAGGVES